MAVIMAAAVVDSTAVAVVAASTAVAVVMVVADTGKSSPRVECKSGCGFHSRSRFFTGVSVSSSGYFYVSLLSASVVAS